MKVPFKIILFSSILILGMGTHNFLYSQRVFFHTLSFFHSYYCLPCGTECDGKEYSEPGKCPHCNMPLVEKSTMNFVQIKPQKLRWFLSKHPDVVILDVRTKDEFEGKTTHLGRIKNSINIPIQEMENRWSELLPYKNKPLLVYCSQSHRSPQVAYFLGQKGFNKVVNLQGGLSVLKDKSSLEKD